MFAPPSLEFQIFKKERRRQKTKTNKMGKQVNLLKSSKVFDISVTCIQSPSQPDFENAPVHYNVIK